MASSSSTSRSRTSPTVARFDAQRRAGRTLPTLNLTCPVTVTRVRTVPRATSPIGGRKMQRRKALAVAGTIAVTASAFRRCILRPPMGDCPWHHADPGPVLGQVRVKFEQSLTHLGVSCHGAAPTCQMTTPSPAPLAKGLGREEGSGQQVATGAERPGEQVLPIWSCSISGCPLWTGTSSIRRLKSTSDVAHHRDPAGAAGRCVVGLGIGRQPREATQKSFSLLQDFSGSLWFR